MPALSEALQRETRLHLTSSLTEDLLVEDLEQDLEGACPHNPERRAEVDFTYDPPLSPAAQA